MKHLKGFNENNDLPEGLNVNGLKCDNPNCDWSDMSVPFSDYEKSINKPCPQCGENLLTQEDYDQVIQIKQAMELMATFSEEELNNIVSSLSEEEIDQALDKMNQLKMKKKGEDEQGREIWSIGESRELKNINNMGDNKIKSYGNFLNEKEDLPKVTWDRILFGKSIKEILYDIYSEINPVLKWKKMEKYHKELKDSVEKGQKELEERKKILKELEDEIAKKNQKSEERGKFVKNFEDDMGKFNEGWFSKDEENEPVDAVNSKIEDAAYSLGSFGTMTKQAAFINGAKWAIQNLTDDEIKLLRENTDKDDHSFFGL